MINWSSQVPQDDNRHGMELVRTPATAKLEGIITSRSIVGTYTHFHNRRTIPCFGKECEACNSNATRRWHGWVSMLELPLKEHVIFETTAQACEQLQKAFQSRKNLRGSWFYAWRPAKVANGRVVVRKVERYFDEEQLPEEVDLMKILTAIWGVPYKAREADVVRNKREPISNGESNGEALEFAEPRNPR